jgi:hypothetical protein
VFLSGSVFLLLMPLRVGVVAMVWHVWVVHLVLTLFSERLVHFVFSLFAHRFFHLALAALSNGSFVVVILLNLFVFSVGLLNLPGR